MIPLHNQILHKKFSIAIYRHYTALHILTPTGIEGAKCDTTVEFDASAPSPKINQLRFGQIHFAIWANTFCNLDKDVTLWPPNAVNDDGLVPNGHLRV